MVTSDLPVADPGVGSVLARSGRGWDGSGREAEEQLAASMVLQALRDPHHDPHGAGTRCRRRRRNTHVLHGP